MGERRVRALECGKQGGSLWDTLDSPLLDQMEPTKPQLSHLEEVGEPKDVRSMLVELQSKVNYLEQMPSQREVGPSSEKYEGGVTPLERLEMTEAAASLFAGFEERIEASLQHVLDRLREVEERLSEPRTATTGVTSYMKSEWNNENADLLSMYEDPRGMQAHLFRAREREQPQLWTAMPETGRQQFSPVAAGLHDFDDDWFTDA